MFMYEVKSGDTLYGISKKYGISVDEIMKLNYLKNTNLTLGQIIRIPEMYFDMDNMTLPNFINYTVKNGDTLYKIAKENNISIDILEKDNALTSPILKVGQVLKIRLPEGSTIEIEECIGPDYNPPSDNTISYTVKKGDSLYSIAKSYNTSVSNIMNLNNLSTSNLSVGQVLKLTNSNTIYTVKKGDSLYTISKKYNISIDAIKKKNNLTSNMLSIGQKLIL